MKSIDETNSLHESPHPPRVVAICASSGGIPKWTLPFARVTRNGIEGDQHNHEKHNRPDRAVSIFDVETMRDLIAEGFPLGPGTAGENLTVEGLHVQKMQPGILIEIGSVILRLEEPRKPCFVLDAINPHLKEAILGRCGFMASVAREGTIEPGMPIRCHQSCEQEIPTRKQEIGG